MTASVESQAADALAVRHRLPDFFIAGHHKCGTTALYRMLKQHPQIFMSAIKEPRFFATDARSRFQPVRGHVLPQTLEEYLALFAAARPDQLAGEASPSYLWSRTAAAEIVRVQPNARVIAILREPAAFLRSLHLQLLRSHVESQKDLRKALALESARRDGRHIPRRSHLPQLLQYADHVRYVEQLRRYEAVLPRENLLVIVYDDFRSDNAATLARVLRFLGVDDTHEFDPLEAERTTRTVRSHQLDDALHSVAMGRAPIARGARAALKAMTPRALRRGTWAALRARGVYRDAPPPDEALMGELRERFRGEVEALSAYLDRDMIECWGYDRRSDA
jgi:hypothetical protein